MYLVFDIGGTKTRMSTTRNGNELGPVEIWPTPPDFTAGISEIARRVGSLALSGPVTATAVGIAAIMGQDPNQPFRLPHLPGWTGQPLVAEISKITGSEVLVKNDAALAALGEANFGAGRGHQIVTYITISTGVGGARVVSGRLDSSAYGFEPGFQLLFLNDQAKYWEDLISGSAMEKSFGRSPQDITEPVVWDRQFQLIATGLHNITVIWSPQIIVLGGGVSASLNLDRITHFLKQFQVFPTVPELKLAQLNESSALYGAMHFLTHRSSSAHPTAVGFNGI